MMRIVGWGSTGVPCSGSITTRQWQCGRPVGRDAGRAVDRPHLRVRVGGARGRVEGRVFDVVAHAVHELFAHRLDVHQRAAVVEPELAVLRVVDLVPEVHELMRRADVELDVLEDRRHVGVAEVERALRAQRVERARGHPLLDRDVEHVLAGVTGEHERDADAVLEMAVQQVLAAEPGEGAAREVGERQASGSNGPE